MARPAQLTAFRHLVPQAIQARFQRGSAARSRLDRILLDSGGFDPRMEAMITQSDDFVGAPFFWSAEVLSLCNASRVAHDYPSLGTACGTAANGRELQLFALLLTLLLRLASLQDGGTNHQKIAQRTREVLVQRDA